MCFSVNFAKFLGTPFLTEHLLWLLQSVRVTESSQQVKIQSKSVPLSFKGLGHINCNQLDSCILLGIHLEPEVTSLEV